MFQGYVNQGLLAGVALASVPLIIHLLNRQRYKPMEWAAMRFVLAAYRRTRRRVQLENLLLLLLRMGAVALLALAIARPYASGDGAFAPLTERRRDLVLVVDASASTGYREEVESVFQRITSRAGDIIKGLEGNRSDRVQLIVAGTRPRVFGWQAPDKALSLLSTVTRPTDERLDLSATLAEIQSLVEKDAAGTQESAIEVRLLTDLQRASFAGLVDGPVGAEPEGSGDQPLLAQQLDVLESYGVIVVVEDLGPSLTRPPNLTVTNIAVSEGNLITGSPVEIAVSIANHGESPRPAERVSLSLDGNKLPIQRVDVPAQGTTEAIFTVQFEEPGPHSLVAELDGDRLVADDRRATVLIAPPPIRVLVVNGSPSDDFEDDEVGYLMLALEPLSGDGLGAEVRPFDAAEITVDRLTDPELHLRSYEVIVLAGLSVVTEAAVQRLEARVASGASLVIAMGPRVADLTVTNRALYRPDGSGLLPAELVRRFSVARRDSYYRVAAFEEAHPALSFFADETWRPFLQEIPIYEFVQVRPLDDARVLASLDDDGRSPLLIERPFDQGRVFLYTSSFHPSWSDMEDSPRTLIPLTHEWLRYAGTRREPPRVLSPGAPLSLVVDTYPRLTELVLPDGDRRALEGTPEELSDGRWRLPQIPGERTERAGLYIVGLDAGRSEPFAVQLDPGEGDLTRLSTLELEGLHPALQLLARSDDNSSISSEGNTRGEIWRLLATLCLACLIGESLWSAWLGQRRRIG